jgi:hypothetical protein
VISLRELQRDLQRDLFGEPSGIAGAIADDPPLPVEQRLGIYRNAYRSRLIESLGNTYPMLQKYLGNEAFEELGSAFVAEHPSGYRSIRWYGSELAEFVAASAFPERAMLAEMARFEWTLTEVFDSADAASLDRTALMGVPPDAWARLRFRFHPSLRHLAFEWNAVAVWKALSADSDLPAPEESESAVEWLLWRRSLENYFRSIDPAESAALEIARRGETFEAICVELGAQLPEEEVPLRAAGLVAGWLDSALIVELTD